jgi:hypothetical protein
VMSSIQGLAILSEDTLSFSLYKDSRNILANRGHDPQI